MPGVRAVSRRSRRSRRFLFTPADSVLPTGGVQLQPHCVVRPAMNQKSRHYPFSAKSQPILSVCLSAIYSWSGELKARMTMVVRLQLIEIGCLPKRRGLLC
jgi:hypothetical protein